MLLELRGRSIGPLVHAIAEVARPILHLGDQGIGLGGLACDRGHRSEHSPCSGQACRAKEPATIEKIRG